MFYKKLFLLITLGVSVWFEQPLFPVAEYVFIHSDGSQITESEHAQIFKILNDYQFPMCLCNAALRSSVGDYLERDVVLSKIPKNITVHIIPKTLYGLLFVDECVGLEHGGGGELLSLVNTIYVQHSSCLAGSYPEDYQSLYEEYLHRINEFNNSKNLRRMHFIFNQKCAYMIGNINGFISNIQTQHSVNALIPNVVAMYTGKSQFGNFYTPHVARLADSANHKLLLDACRAELQCIEQSSCANYMLYRGTNGVEGKLDSTIAVEKSESSVYDDDFFVPVEPVRYSKSLSYGNGVFEGIFLDGGACAFSYMSNSYGRACKIAYAVNVKKIDFILGGGAFFLFFIPALSTIAGICLRGETFHARSKMTNVEGVKKLRLCGFDALPDLPERFFQAHESFDMDVLEAVFQNYIYHNSIIIKNNSGMDGILKPALTPSSEHQFPKPMFASSIKDQSLKPVFKLPVNTETVHSSGYQSINSSSSKILLTLAAGAVVGGAALTALVIKLRSKKRQKKWAEIKKTSQFSEQNAEDVPLIESTK